MWWTSNLLTKGPFGFPVGEAKGSSAVQLQQLRITETKLYIMRPD